MDELVFKIVLLGSHAVGKSALATSLAQHEPLSAAFSPRESDSAAGGSSSAGAMADDEPLPTIGVDVFSYIDHTMLSTSTSAVPIECAVRVQLWDVAGKAVYAPPDLPHVLRGSSVVLLCYDAGSEASLSELIERYVPLAVTHSGASSVLLIQTKRDTIAKKAVKPVALGLKQHKDAAKGPTQEADEPLYDALRRVRSAIDNCRTRESAQRSDTLPVRFVTTSVLEPTSVSTCRVELLKLALDSFEGNFVAAAEDDVEDLVPSAEDSQASREPSPEIPREEEEDVSGEVEKEQEDDEGTEPPPVAETKMGVNRLQALQQAAQRQQQAAASKQPVRQEEDESEKESTAEVNGSAKSDDDEEDEESEDRSTAKPEAAPPAVHPRLAAAMQRLQHHEKALEDKSKQRSSGRTDRSKKGNTESDDDDEGSKGGKGKKGKSKDKSKDHKPCDGCCAVM